MKKLMTTILALLLTATLAACGQEAGGAAQGSGTDIGSTSSGADETDGADQDSTYIYGKITGMVGNEAEVAEAKLPETEMGEGGASGSEPAGGNMQAAPMTPATTLEPAEGDTDAVIELTGEVYSLTVPSGVKIHSMGQEVTLAALKKGSIVMVRVDNLTEKNVISVDVLQ